MQAGPVYGLNIQAPLTTGGAFAVLALSANSDLAYQEGRMTEITIEIEDGWEECETCGMWEWLDIVVRSDVREYRTGGDTHMGNGTMLYDLEKKFQAIVNGVNRVLGRAAFGFSWRHEATYWDDWTVKGERTLELDVTHHHVVPLLAEYVVIVREIENDMDEDNLKEEVRASLVDGCGCLVVDFPVSPAFEWRGMIQAMSEALPDATLELIEDGEMWTTSHQSGV